jgi:hypothetical protein
MRFVFFILILFTLTSCNGYKPLLKGQDINFTIENIKIISDDDISKRIVKRLESYNSKNNQKKLTLEIKTSKKDEIISKDNKGDPLIFKLTVNVEVKVDSSNNQKKLIYGGNSNYNNQSNKFELNQYKRNLQENLVNKIIEKLILDLVNYE